MLTQRRSHAHRRRTAAQGAVENLWHVEFDGADTDLACGSDASLDNLPASAFTAECWFRADSAGEGNAARLMGKLGAGVGWQIAFQDADTIKGVIGHATTDAIKMYDFTPDSAWHHLAMTWDPSWDYPKLWLDGAEVSTIDQVKAGALDDDSAKDFSIGSRPTGNNVFDGAIGWLRLSTGLRYTTGFTPAGRGYPPDVDGTTIEIWPMNEGTGATVAASVNASNNGTLSNGAWSQG